MGPPTPPRAGVAGGLGEGTVVLGGRLLGRLGAYEVRLSDGDRDVQLAQSLRHRVFRAGAEAAGEAGGPLREEDRFDAFCDHLLLVDPTRGADPASRVVGTYRLLMQERALEAGGFYGQAEFDVASLVARHPGRRFLELGRSCVLPDYRGRRTMELLWHGIWAYVLAHRVEVLFGCASLSGIDPDECRGPLAFLRAHALAPPEWQAEATAPERYDLPADGDAAESLRAVPPLVRGYLRLGGQVSRQAVIDRDFGTTDVLLVLPRERISPRYVAHYGAAAERYA